MRTVGVVLLGLGLSLSSPAWADDTKEKGVETATDLARALHSEGNDVLKKDGCKKAVLYLRSAYLTEPLHQIAGTLGQCEMELERYVDAATHLEQFVREYDPQKDPQKHELAKGMLAEAKKHVVTLSLKGISAGAEVFVDGESKGVSPIEAEIYVEPGSHTVRAVLGRMVGEREVEGQAGERRAASMTLQSLTTSPQQQTGLSARSTTGIALLATGLTAVAGGVGLGVWARMNEGSLSTTLDGSPLKAGGSTPQGTGATPDQGQCVNGSDSTVDCMAWARVKGQLDVLSRLNTWPFIFAGAGAAVATAGAVMRLVPESSPVNVRVAVNPFAGIVQIRADF